MNTVPRALPDGARQHAAAMSACGMLSVFRCMISSVVTRGADAIAHAGAASVSAAPISSFTSDVHRIGISFARSDVEVHAELERVRPHADRIDLVLLLVLDPVVDHVR